MPDFLNPVPEQFKSLIKTDIGRYAAENWNCERLKARIKKVVDWNCIMAAAS
jgi:hypothetical protein